MCHAEGLTNSHRHGANNNTLKKKKIRTHTSPPTCFVIEQTMMRTYYNT